MARDRARPEARDADAAAAAGRRRQRQDDRRRAGRAAGDRERHAGRVHGADRNPGRAALPQARALARRTCRSRSRGSPAGFRRRRGARRSAAIGSGDAMFAIGTHALFEDEVALPQARARDRRRAASLRRRAAAAPARQGAGRSAPADDERDADSAHARDDVLRRPRRIDAGRDAARTHAGRDASRQQQAARRRSSSASARRAGRGARRTGCAR